MKISQLLVEAKQKKVVVVYGGRFQPFHKGHLNAYRWLCKKFGKGNVWIATSDKTNFDEKKGDVSPFSFKEKKELIISLYGLPERRIVQCRNPAFKPDEIFELYKKYPIVYVTAVGSKDKSRYENTDFFEPIPDKESQWKTIDDNVGYYVEIPMEKNLSGTEVRQGLKTAEGEEREKLFKRYFGQYDSTLDQLITSKLKETNDDA